LTLQGTKLYLFNDRTDEMPHGVVELEGCSVKREQVQKNKKKKQDNAKHFVFLLSNDSLGLQTRFKGTTEREMAEWLAALDIACRKALSSDDDASLTDRANNLSQRRRGDSILRFYGQSGSSIAGSDY